MDCPRCRKRVPDEGLHFCPLCGERLADVAARPTTGRRGGRVVLAAILAGALLFGGGYIVAQLVPGHQATSASLSQEPGKLTTSTGATGASTAPGALPTGTATGGATSTARPIVESAHPYAANFNQTWTLTRPGASEMRLRFARINLGAGDTLSVQCAVKVHNYGACNASNVWTDWIRTDIVYVRLASDASSNAYGFAVDKVETRTGIGPATSAVAESFHPYADGCRYTWTVTKAGAQKMRLHFTKVELGGGDYLRLTDPTGKILKVFSEKTAQTDFWTDWFVTGTVEIEFATNFGDCRYGFTIDTIETR